jgi:hypothetical protein
LHVKNNVPGKHAALQTTLLCSVSIIAFGGIDYKAALFGAAIQNFTITNAALTVPKRRDLADSYPSATEDALR